MQSPRGAGVTFGEVQQVNGTAVVTNEPGQDLTGRTHRLPLRASAYGGAVAVAALVAASASFASLAPSTRELTSFAILLPLAALAPHFRVAVGRNHSFHAAPAFVVAGALVLPPALVVALTVALHVSQWGRDRYPWYIQGFNFSNYMLSALAAWLAAESIGRGGDVSFALGGLAAALAFVGLNHVLLAAMLGLVHGHSFRDTGLFAGPELGIDLGLAGLGVAVGAFAEINPWLLPALIAPLILTHRSLSTQGQLRDSEERFRTMFEGAPTATLLFDAEGRIVAANRSAETMLGYQEDELRGHAPGEMRHPEDSREGDRLFAEVLRGERDSLRREARYVRKDGTVVVARLAVAAVRDADGRTNYVIGMAEDVTEQKQLEEQLRQSQKLEAVGRLAGGVAHDFNNMLTAIGGHTSFALEHAPEGSPMRSNLDEVRKATERAALLTRQLLAFSRKQVLQPEVLDLNAIVAELESMLRPLLAQDVLLTTELDPTLGSIEADPGQLQQVVMNLVVNARDAMPGGGTVAIETANADVDEIGDGAMEPGPYVTLTVRDAGEGIDEGTIGQIFDPFFTTKAPGKGTGLGLATVYGIVKQSGGYVSVETEVGAGSAFTIYLRRFVGTASPAPVPPPAAPTPAETPAKTTVLVVDDEEVVRSLVHQVLEGQGYHVLVAHDGEEGIAVAGAHNVHLLVTDLSMPKLGGRELAEQLRKGNPGLKVLYMSGYAESGISSDRVLPPATAFIGKPFTLAELTAVVQNMLTLD